jgi:hypothetical protein
MQGRDASRESDTAQAFDEPAKWSLKSNRVKIQFPTRMPISPQAFLIDTDEIF